MSAEKQRLQSSENREADWKNWGPYVSDRAWGTVREDYSENGAAWEYFDFGQSHKRAYRWNEDGIAGICNRLQNICLSVALWNEKDPILKERFFGVTGNQGNHGEDVKEYYFYLDNTPTHSYMKMLYKYPHCRYPYELLVEKNQSRDKNMPEFELIDALKDEFESDKYFDVFVEYAKADEEDILCRITVKNKSANETAPIHVLPHIWYRNDWSWNHNHKISKLYQVEDHIETDHRHLGKRYFYIQAQQNNQHQQGEFLFTENNSNLQSLFNSNNETQFVKDGINNYIINKDDNTINPNKEGSKACAHFSFLLNPLEEITIEYRFCNKENNDAFIDFDEFFYKRKMEADEFYNGIHADLLNDDERFVQRQAFSGLLWTKQFYHYAVELWKKGDPAYPPPPHERYFGRNSDWDHLYNLDVISMPDKWEYPWFAAWDLAFHTIPIAMIDPEWAKRQLILMMREWYMHPNGQIPAYEWAFGDVNPPVHAWACYRVYEITKEKNAKFGDINFLEKVFHKLLLNFTWWVNRKDKNGNNVFQGGFLGLDNIGVFDRSQPLPDGIRLDQADGTAWMGMFALNMLTISLELAQYNNSYEDVATKFFEHFVYISNAINKSCYDGGLWDENDSMYYDNLHFSDNSRRPVCLQSFVCLIPIYAVSTLHPNILDNLPHFKRRCEWFIQYRPHLMQNLTFKTGTDGRYLLSIVSEDKLKRISTKMFDENQFLSNYGLRSLSKRYESTPFTMIHDVTEYCVSYQPGESNTFLFGGNSNWRGPIWFPTNYLMVESLCRFYCYFGDDFKIEYPTSSGNYLSLLEISQDLARRLCSIFLLNDDNQRPFLGDYWLFQNDENWRDHILFYEYFHGDNGLGIGASHQTGWTALVAKLLNDCVKCSQSREGKLTIDQ